MKVLKMEEKAQFNCILEAFGSMMIRQTLREKGQSLARTS